MKNFIDKLGPNVAGSVVIRDYDNEKNTHSELETVNKLDILTPQDL